MVLGSHTREGVKLEVGPGCTRLASAIWSQVQEVKYGSLVEAAGEYDRGGNMAPD